MVSPHFQRTFTVVHTYGERTSFAVFTALRWKCGESLWKCGENCERSSFTVGVNYGESAVKPSLTVSHRLSPFLTVVSPSESAVKVRWKCGDGFSPFFTVLHMVFFHGNLTAFSPPFHRLFRVRWLFQAFWNLPSPYPHRSWQYVRVPVTIRGLKFEQKMI